MFRCSVLMKLLGVVVVHLVYVFEFQFDISVFYVGSMLALEIYGRDGSGVSIGIIDLGIDYFYEIFGGGGVVDHYVLNEDISIEDGLGDIVFFFILKVVGGYDFVGLDYKGGGLSLFKSDLDFMFDHELVEKKGIVKQNFQ